MSAVEEAFALRERVSELFNTAARPLAAFIAAPTASLPRPLRPFQAGYRRACDIHSRTGVVGQALSSGVIFNSMCSDYLGANNPTFSPGSQTVCLTFEYNEVASPGQPWAGPITTCGIPVPYQIKGPELGSVPGFAGCIYAETANGNIALSCTNFAQFVPDLQIRNVQESPDAGDPPAYNPVLPPPAPPNTFIYSDNDGPSVTVNVGSPVVNVDNSASLVVDVGGIQIDLFGGEPGGSNKADDGERYPQQEEGTSVPTNASQETGETPQGKRLVGVRIFVSTPWSFDTQVDAGLGKTLIIPRHGQLYFVDRTGRDFGPFDVRRIQQVIPCPPENDFLKVRSVPLPGVVWTVQPVYVSEV